MIFKKFTVNNQNTKTQHQACIRLLNEDDLAAYQKLDEEIVSTLQQKGIYQKNTEEFARNCISQKTGFGFGCFVEDEIVAYSMIFVPGDSPKNLGLDVDLPRAYLSRVVHRDSVGVKPAFRGNGIQGVLGRISTKIMLEKGYPYVFSTVHPTNIPSLRSLTKQEFVIVKLKKKYGGKWRCILQYFPLPERLPSTDSIILHSSKILEAQALLEEGYLGVDAMKDGKIRYEKIGSKNMDSLH